MHALSTSFLTRRQAIVWRIADAVGAGERNFQRMVGADWATAYHHDVEAMTDTIELLTAADRPAVHLQPRMITGKGNG